jgi:hypothetical protein
VIACFECVLIGNLCHVDTLMLELTMMLVMKYSISPSKPCIMCQSPMVITRDTTFGEWFSHMYSASLWQHKS